MTTVKIIDLKLSKFKGAHTFELIVNGDNATIYGDNATGKTTIADAFNWILFDKDSNNKKDFEIKTKVNGETLHKAEHTVEMTIEANERIVHLKKVYKEVWTKKRGAATSDFTGHTTDYAVDDVPTSKKDYDALITSLINADTFKLLTSPTYFSEQVKWQDQRKVLVELAGSVTTEDVVTKNQKLAKVDELLNGKNEDDFYKSLKAKQKKLNEEIKMIPIRIAENQKNLTSHDSDIEYKSKLTELEKELEESQQQIFNIKNGAAVTQKKQELFELKNGMKTYANEFTYEFNNKLNQLKVKLQEEQANLMNLQSPVRNANQEIQSIQQSIVRHNNWIDKLTEERKELLAKWHKKNKEEFQHQDSCVCPTCDQDLPAEQVDAARQKATEEFNLAKSKILADITAEGKGIANNISNVSEEIGTLETQKEKLTLQIEESNVLIVKKEEAIAKLQKQITDAENTAPNVDSDEQYQGMNQSASNLQNEIEELQSHADEAIDTINIDINRIRADKDLVNAAIAKIASQKDIVDRIAELEDQEEKLAKEYAKYSEQIYLVEQFVSAKVELLEEKINSRFKLAKFKLFNKQVNGGLEECCEVMVDGVTYGGGLNNAMRINVGLDIINTLSEHYDTYAPIFIDNAESVTQLIDTKSQMFALVVSEQDKELRIEVAEREVSIS